MTCGSVVAAITTQWFNPFITYGFGAAFAIIQVLAGFLIAPEMETNDYALHLSEEDKMYLEE